MIEILREAILKCRAFERRLIYPDDRIGEIITGLVAVQSIEPDVFLMDEQGKWNHKLVNSNNRYRWHLFDKHIRIEREMQGVFHVLSHLKYKDNDYVSETDYCCGNDHYWARLQVASHRFTLCWQVKGPRKDYQLVTDYR